MFLFGSFDLTTLDEKGMPLEASNNKYSTYTSYAIWLQAKKTAQWLFKTGKQDGLFMPVIAMRSNVVIGG